MRGTVTVALVLTAGLVSACGGGGSDAGVSAQAQLLSINSTNQQAVSRATATATTALLGAGGGVAGQSSSADRSTALSVSSVMASHGGPSLASMALYMAHKVAGTNDGQRSALSAGTARTLVIAPISSACSVSGTVTTTINDADNNGTLTAGDTLTLTFNQCHETAADNLNGSMAMSLSRLTIVGDAATALEGTLSMQQLSVSDGVRTASMNGSFSMAFNQLSASQSQVALTVGSGGLNASVSDGGISDSVSFESGFALSMTETDSTTVGGADTASATLNGGFSSTAIGGRLLLETSVPILQWSTEDYPRAGTLRVVGNASALRVQVLNATTVRLELDGNLDGTYEQSTDLPWTTVLPG